MATPTISENRARPIKNMRADLSADYVRNILYIGEDGLLRWRANRPPRAIANQIAGTQKSGAQLYIGIDGKQYLAIRLKYLMEHGHWPRNECAICCRDFSGDRISSLYCSPKCRQKARRRADAERYPRERMRRKTYATNYYWTFREELRAAQKARRSIPEVFAAKRTSDAAWYAENRDHACAVNRQNGARIRLEIPWKHLLSAARARAQKRGQPFDLTEEWARSRWTGHCELSGLPFRRNEKTDKKTADIYSASIDKIDPNLGYLQSNCRFILFAINALKHDATDVDIIRIAWALIKNHLLEAAE